MFTRQGFLMSILLIFALSGVGTLTAENQSLASFDKGMTKGGGELHGEANTSLISKTSCEGNNQDNNFLDNVSMGGPMIGISWVPSNSVTITRIEVFTGETTGPVALAIWSDDGGNPSRSIYQAL